MNATTGGCTLVLADHGAAAPPGSPRADACDPRKGCALEDAAPLLERQPTVRARIDAAIVVSELIRVVLALALVAAAVLA